MFDDCGGEDEVFVVEVVVVVVGVVKVGVRVVCDVVCWRDDVFLIVFVYKWELLFVFGELCECLFELV